MSYITCPRPRKSAGDAHKFYEHHGVAGGRGGLDCRHPPCDAKQETLPDSTVFTPEFARLGHVIGEVVQLLAGPIEETEYRNAVVRGLLQEMKNSTKSEVPEDEEESLPKRPANSPHKLQQLCDDFVEKLRQTSPTEHAQIYLYQKPKCSGDLSEKVLHLLMCAVPDEKGGQTLKNEMPEFLEDAATVGWLYEMYPEARDSHGVHDHVFKRINHGKEDEKSGKWRKKKVPEELYAGGVDKLCENLFDKAFLEAHEFDVLIVHCVPARGFVSREFGGEDDWGINRDVDIGGKFAHPTYLHVYADQKNLNKFVELIERQQIELDIKVDLSKLQKRLRAMAVQPEAKSYPHLKDVVVNFSSQEEMLVKKEQFKAKRREIGRKMRDRVRAGAAAGDPQAMAVMEKWNRKVKSISPYSTPRHEPSVANTLQRRIKDYASVLKLAIRRQWRKRKDRADAAIAAGDPDAIARRDQAKISRTKQRADQKAGVGAWASAQSVPCKTEGCKEMALTLRKDKNFQKYCTECLAHRHQSQTTANHVVTSYGVCVEEGCTEQTDLIGDQKKPKRCPKCVKAHAKQDKLLFNQKKKERTSQSADGTLLGVCKTDGCDEGTQQRRKAPIYCDKCKNKRDYVRKKSKKGVGSKGKSASSTQTALGMFGFETAQKEETDEEEVEESD
ncbi:hypothetical protein LTR15_000346 [Elasticomyces elasticus]|nr:hypothetical protein LTR15_000346 [Elasticomyces elasticus]